MPAGRAGVLVLTGQTASGKSELALELAERFDAEIIGADSRQIYRGMPIGTAAPDARTLARVPHHLIGSLDPSERYSAARFVRDAAAALDEIASRGKRAIVVGGTGFYLRALCGDVTLAGAHDAASRRRLAREVRVHPAPVLHEWLATLDPAAAKRLAPGDTYRITRALEIALAQRDQADGAAEAEELPTLRRRGQPFQKVFLEIEPEALAARIVARVDAMLASGFIDEAERIGVAAVAADAVGYPQALAFRRGLLSTAELRALLIRATRRYAKRQATWFRAEPGLERVSRANAVDRITSLVAALAWSR